MTKNNSASQENASQRRGSSFKKFFSNHKQTIIKLAVAAVLVAASVTTVVGVVVIAELPLELAILSASPFAILGCALVRGGCCISFGRDRGSSMAMLEENINDFPQSPTSSDDPSTKLNRLASSVSTLSNEQSVSQESSSSPEPADAGTTDRLISVIY